MILMMRPDSRSHGGRGEESPHAEGDESHVEGSKIITFDGLAGSRAPMGLAVAL